MTASPTYVALRSFRASHDGKTWHVAVGDELPNAGEWKALDRMVALGYVGMVPLSIGADADDASPLAELERRGVDLLSHLESRLDPREVLGRFSDELLHAEVERRAQPADDTDDATAGDQPATDAGGAAGMVDAGEGGAGADASEPPPLADPPIDLEALTVPQLQEIAAARDIDLPSHARKAEMIKLLARQESTS